MTNVLMTATSSMLAKLADTKPFNEELASLLLKLHHPQTLTHAFHYVFNAPVADEAPDSTFSHMTDERVAVRVSFLLSEIFELLKDGLGLDAELMIRAGTNSPHFANCASNGELATAVLGAMEDSPYRNLVGVVDALGDINVVNNGFAVELGVDMGKVDREIFASNMTKLDDEGNPIIADGSDARYPKGKILKGPNFMEPQIAALLGV